jgi:hypothetical protein
LLPKRARENIHRWVIHKLTYAHLSCFSVLLRFFRFCPIRNFNFLKLNPLCDRKRWQISNLGSLKTSPSFIMQKLFHKAFHPLMVEERKRKWNFLCYFSSFFMIICKIFSGDLHRHSESSGEICGLLCCVVLDALWECSMTQWAKETLNMIRPHSDDIAITAVYTFK